MWEFRGWQVCEYFCVFAGEQQSCMGTQWQLLKTFVEILVVSHHQPASLQRLRDNSSGVEWMKPLTTMLQYQHRGTIGDLRNRRAVA